MQDLDQLIRPLPVDGLAVVDAPPEPTTKAARRIVRRIKRRRFLRLQQHQAAVEDLRPLPRRGESVHGVTAGAFSGWNLASAAVELLQPEPIDSLTVATLGFNRENADSLCALLDGGRVRSVLLLVSDYFRSSDRAIFADIRRELEARGQRVVIARSHAKLILIKTPTRAIVIETSANLRSSMNWEQFVINDDAALLAFHAGWITDLMETTP